MGLQRQLKWAINDSFEIHTARDRSEALSLLTRIRPSIVLLDLGLPPDVSGASEGFAILETIADLYPDTKVIVASGHVERSTAMRAISLGAYDFFSKPVDADDLTLVLERAWQLHALELDNRRLCEQQHPVLEGILTLAPEMAAVCRLVERIAAADVSVLVLGESGTGKEMIVNALHHLSSRATSPLVAINCASIPEALLESELFGHERGAFTDAIRQTIGKAEQAQGGTLFLDEIGDMPLLIQAKFLRFLQGRSFQRVGGHEEIHVDVRIVSATHRDLPRMIQEGTFREDLFYRLNEVQVDIPPLRQREGDIELLAQTFLVRFSTRYNKGPLQYSAGALTAMKRYAWPGNVRELENRVRRAVILGQGGVITTADLEFDGVRDDESPASLKEARRKAEGRALEKAIMATGYNLSRAAQLLDISRPTLYALLSTYEIKIPQRTAKGMRMMGDGEDHPIAG